MSNRTFRDIAKHGHPEDPQQWERVDDEYDAVKAACAHLGNAIDELVDMKPEPSWLDRIMDINDEMHLALSGEQEEAE